MDGAFCFCVNGMKRKIALRRDKKKFLRIIQKAHVDSQNDFKKKCIISKIDRGSELEILEMSDFTPEESLGSGVSSDVCLLFRKQDGQKFAGKFIKSEIGSKDFINEAKILKSCSNACATIVNLVGITTTPKCLVLELHANGNLDKALQKDNLNVKRGKETEFPFLRRMNYILDVCKAVDHLHRVNICHRDIAMRNLLLSDDKKHVVLTDFSLSRVVSSAIKSQLTLTNLVPTKSAPETIRQNSSESSLENWERYYSLKSDIWSLGVTMFEIIDKEELGDITESRDMPSRFPKERLPSTEIFNRMQDLWILILRCWNEKPEDRPQSWDVEEQIEMLIADPLNVGNEDDGYIRAWSKGIIFESTSTEQSSASCYSQPGIPAYGSCMDKVYEDLRLPSLSLQFESPSCSMLRKQDSEESLIRWVKKDFFRKMSNQVRRPDNITEGHVRKSQSDKKYKLFRSLDKYHLIPLGALSNTGGLQLTPKNLQILNFPSRRNKSDPALSNSSLSRSESVSSLLSSSVSSKYEESITRERVQYCSPLLGSFKSTATNIRYCKDRRFFEKLTPNVMEEEKPDSSDCLYAPDTPKSGGSDEHPAAINFFKIYRL